LKEGKVVTLAPLDLMSAHPWAPAAFTTYALSLSFFEAVLLDALVRGGGREALKRGRVLLSGSANATVAAFGGDRNVEACVARIQREQTVGWRFTPLEPPELRVAPDDEPDWVEDVPGVLRTLLEGDQVIGQVLTPPMSGQASVFQVTTEGPEPLGETRLEPDGSFRVSAAGLEVQSWKGGRLVLRVVQIASGRCAEGFISVPVFAAMTRRVGALGARLFAVLMGTETPADVAAIMRNDVISSQIGRDRDPKGQGIGARRE
jgi:hypothetical protein